MLNQIYIRDLATISTVELHLQPGNTMITGETGAGKSVFIEAIELALGGRASQNLVRLGKEKAEINLCFDISNFPKVIDRLKQVDLYDDANECIIRRVITDDGRSRSYVNGAPAALQFVKELGELLFHLHGQHEQQVLLKAETQREMLDRYADTVILANDVREMADQWKKLENKMNDLREKSHERKERSDYLHFQLEELLALKLTENEWETLEKEHHRLTHADELMSQLQKVSQQLSQDEEQSVISNLHSARKLLEPLASFESKIDNWLSIVNSILIQLNEFTSDMQAYLEKTDLDPIKLQEIESRVSQIFNLSRKHKVQPENLYSFQIQLAQELNTLNHSDETIQTLILQQTEIAEKYREKASQLSVSRKNAALKLEKEITKTIQSLSLPYGEFHIALENNMNTAISLHGNEKIIFLIKTNPDAALQPLAKIISGGELSRLSLALHLALAHRVTIPTLVFDEVDTGLSGATAEKIGKLLRKLGESYQVFCVTHQAQIAACGHHHLLVEKTFVEKTTHTTLRLLSIDERTREIARMLAGEKITEKTLAHAREVLESV